MWWLILLMNGYTVDYSSFKSYKDCMDHWKTVNFALRQVESKAEVRCEWREREDKDGSQKLSKDPRKAEKF